MSMKTPENIDPVVRQLLHEARTGLGEVEENIRVLVRMKGLEDEIYDRRMCDLETGIDRTLEEFERMIRLCLGP
tara:strand:- start:4333 stop:4554 length:222 start_codon:yes stop_codon:yes gene_type:complete